MSGLFGIIHSGAHRKAPVPPDYAPAMCAALRHLGPDGSAVLEHSGIVLGHLSRRITPESVYEKLPLSSSCGRYIITSNSRIDNREDLFSILDVSHAPCSQVPDSLLILECYKKWGAHCPARILGEFTFAIWDLREESLFCACDHMALRSFFYYFDGEIFAFASQLSGLMALPFVTMELEESHLGRFLRLPADTHADGTLYKHIKKLNGSRLLILRDRQLIIRPYWTPDQIKPVRFRRDHEYADALRELLTHAVGCCLRRLPHVDAAVTLSGGLDSSSIACLAARQLAKENKRLTAVAGVLPRNHDGIEQDERFYIDAVNAQEPNIDLIYVTAGERGPFEALEQAFAETYRPVRPYYFLHRALWETAADQGARLLFYGEGGDHMASYRGKDSLARLVLHGRWLKTLTQARRMAHSTGVSLGKIIKSRIIRLLLPRWIHKPPVSPLYTAAHNDFIQRLGIHTHNSPADSARSILYPHIMLEKLTAGTFALAADYNRMSHTGLSGLYPFMDKKVMEFCLAIPPDQFIVDGHERSLLRRAMEGILPPPVQWRKDKAPFSPDFHRRVKHTTHQITSFLDTLGSHDPVHRFIDVTAIRAAIADIQPARGREDWDIKTNYIVANGFIALKFLKWLEQQGVKIM